MHPIQKLEITKLTRDIVTRFRRRLVDAPVKVGKSGRPRERSKDTVNRDMAAVRAALNQSLQAVAQIRGTSVTMKEKHYAHLRGDVAAIALATLVL